VEFGFPNNVNNLSKNLLILFAHLDHGFKLLDIVPAYWM